MRSHPSAHLAGILLGLFLAAAAPSAAVAAEGAPAPLPPSVRIKPLMVPVISHGKVEKYTQIEVMLEIANATKLGEVQLAMPRLQDAFLSAIYKGVADGWIVRGNIANIPALRQKIEDESTRLLGKDIVSRILITPLARQSAFQ